MTLHELESDEAVRAFYAQHKNALICFSATWCGPCKASKPALTEMAAQYAQDVTKDVKFGIVYEHNLGESVHNYRVHAFPTYVLFVNQTETGRVEGVNLDGIRDMIDRAGCQADLSGGQSLGGAASDATPLSPQEARAQRVAKLGVASTAAPAPAAAAAEADKTPTDEATTAAKTEDVEMKDEATATTTTEDVEMKDVDKEPSPEEAMDPTANLDPESIKTLTEAMGFPLLRAQKGLLYGNGGNVEGAIEWLTKHQDDNDIDDPIPPPAAASGGAVAMSYKCNDCGKILSSMANLELHANKTGHSDFEESTQVVKPLTAEEKAAKVEEIKRLLKAKREEREEAEKEDEKEREKQRRFMGKEMAKTREELDREQRKRDAMLRRKEKENAKKERERIRAELAKDKAERRANQGKLGSKLGVEGYHPDGIQYDVKDGTEQHEEHVKQHHQIKANAAKIDDYIKKVSAYRAGGDGGKCLKILLAYVGNVVDKPDEPKFKTINMENKVFRTKVKPFVGAKQLLLAVGFKQNEGGDALVLKEGADAELLANTKAKLEAAYAAY